MPANSRFDAAVIGAGLLGVFTARSLRQRGLSVCVLEKAGDVCTGISKANAAIVYSGYDVPPDTLKAQLCVPGCSRFPELCRDLDVRYSPCGSVLVCFGPEGEKYIRERFAQGTANAVPGLRLLNREEILDMEPLLRRDVRLGLYAPSAGTVDPWELGIAAYENARSNGAEFRLRTEVLSVSRKDTGTYILTCTTGDTISARCIINCAGLHAAAVRDSFLPPKIGIRTSVTDFAVFGPESEYCAKHIIFSQMEDGTKGVTLIPTVDGRLMAESPVKMKTDGDEAVSSREGQEILLKTARALMPALQDIPVMRFFAATRPNPFSVSDSGQHIGSFSVLEEDGFISLIGIKTPGMTCAEGFGNYVAEKAASYLGISSVNPDFSPRRTAPPRLAELTEEERNRMIHQNPLYGSIVCRCSGISEGEVLDAIHAGARTLDGVKRRCGTALGACQGSFCTAKVAALLSRELNIPVEEVLRLHD